MVLGCISSKDLLLSHICIRWSLYLRLLQNEADIIVFCLKLSVTLPPWLAKIVPILSIRETLQAHPGLHWWVEDFRHRISRWQWKIWLFNFRTPLKLSQKWYNIRKLTRSSPLHKLKCHIAPNMPNFLSFSLFFEPLNVVLVSPF